MGDGAKIGPADWDLAAQAALDFEVDQRISWLMVQAANLNRRG
jgi:hypothetical protein